MKIRQFDNELKQLYHSFHTGGLTSFLAAYENLCRRKFSFHFATAIMEIMLPIRYMCQEALVFEEKIGEYGIASASRQILDRWKVRVRYEFSGHVYQILSGGAFLAYCNHTGGLETILFDSLFQRDDVYQIGASFFPKIGPNISKKIITIDNIELDANDNNGKITLRNRFLDEVGSFIWPPVCDQNTLTTYRVAFKKATDLIAVHRSGVNIAPTGSVKLNAPWRSGLGLIVKMLLRYRPEQRAGIYLIPTVYGMEATHTLASGFLPITSPIRLLAQLQTKVFEADPYIFAPVAIPIDSLDIDKSYSAEDITRLLKRIWLDIQREAHTKYPKRPPLSGVVR